MQVRFMYAPDDAPGGDSGDDDAGGTSPEGQEPDEGKDLIPRAQLHAANREAAKYRTKLRDAEQRLKDLEDAGKSDLERAQEKVKTLEQEKQGLADANRNLQVQVLAEKVGITAAAREDAARLLDWASLPSDPSQQEIEKALKDLVKDRPYLLGKIVGGADGGTGGDPGVRSMNDMLRSGFRR